MSPQQVDLPHDSTTSNNTEVSPISPPSVAAAPISITNQKTIPTTTKTATPIFTDWSSNIATLQAQNPTISLPDINYSGLISTHEVLVTPYDIATLNPNIYINDAVINLSFRMFIPAFGTQQFHFIDTHMSSFITRLSEHIQNNNIPNTEYSEELEYIIERIHFYTRANPQRKISPLPWDKTQGTVFLPLHKSDHWVLAMISLQNCTITVMDSLGSKYGFEFWKQVLTDWINFAAPASFKSRLPKSGLVVTFASANIQHQTKGVDCGAFVVYYALQLMKGVCCLFCGYKSPPFVVVPIILTRMFVCFVLYCLRC